MSDSHREQPVYLVTGAGSGIGRAFVELVAEDPNVQVALLGRRFDALEETLHLAGLDSCRAMAIGCDVADWDAVGSAVDVSVRRWGALTGAFNAAGTFGVFDKLGDEDPAKVKEVIDTNLFGSWVCLSHEARVMRPQRGGAIVMTGSIASFQGHTRSAIYAASFLIKTILAGSFSFAWLPKSITAGPITICSARSAGSPASAGAGLFCEGVPTVEAVSGLAADAGRVWIDSKAAKTAQARRLFFMIEFPVK